MARFTSLLERTLVGKVMELPLDRIVPYQPRQNFDEDSLEELKESICANGLITPITVRQVDGRYEIIAGERRYRACRALGMEKMPCYILSPDEAEAAQMALVENIQRENLSAVEEAQAYVQIMRQAHLSQEQLAAQIGRSQSSVANKIRLLNLPQEVQDAGADRKLSERHARALLALPAEKQTNAYHYIEEMYGKELNDKEKYYKSLVAAQYEKGISEGRANLLTWLVSLIVFSAIAVIAFILYAYRQYKLRVERKIQSEQEKRAMEKKMHEEEMHHKDIQLSTMRSYLLNKINIAKRIEEIRGNKKENVVLTEEDWKEIKIFVNNVEGNFISRLKKRFPKLSDEDVKFMILIRLKMSSKAMGLIYNISEKSIRQKLFVYKSKVDLEGKNSSSLRSYIESF